MRPAMPAARNRSTVLDDWAVARLPTWYYPTPPIEITTRLFHHNRLAQANHGYSASTRWA